MLQAIDKLDKIGRDGVARELVARGFTEEQAKQLFAMLDGESIPGTAEAEAELEADARLRETVRLPARWLADEVVAELERAHEALRNRVDRGAAPRFRTSAPRRPPPPTARPTAARSACTSRRPRLRTAEPVYLCHRGSCTTCTL